MARGWSVSKSTLYLLLLLHTASTVIQLIQLQIFSLIDHIFDEYLNEDKFSKGSFGWG